MDVIMDVIVDVIVDVIMAMIMDVISRRDSLFHMMSLPEDSKRPARPRRK